MGGFYWGASKMSKLTFNEVDAEVNLKEFMNLLPASWLCLVIASGG